MELVTKKPTLEANLTTIFTNIKEVGTRNAVVTQAISEFVLEQVELQRTDSVQEQVSATKIQLTQGLIHTLETQFLFTLNERTYHLYFTGDKAMITYLDLDEKEFNQLGSLPFNLKDRKTNGALYEYINKLDVLLDLAIIHSRTLL